MTVDEQLDRLVAGLEDIFGDVLIGVYLHGSKALGCFGPRSDLDVIVAIRRASTSEEQRLLGAFLLELSQRRGQPMPPHLIELDLVVAPDLHPWRYPTPLHFHYSESLREAFERGDPKPWRVDEYTDFASSLTVLHAGGIVLAGEPVADVFPHVPVKDYRASIVVDRDWCHDNLERFPLHVVLSLPRIWATLATDEVHSKASAAEWALPRLPASLRPVLEHALAVYRGRAEESWAGLPVADYIAYVDEQIAS